MALSASFSQAFLALLRASRCSHLVGPACVSVRYKSSAKTRKFRKADEELDWAAPMLERAGKPKTDEGDPPYMLHVVSRIRTMVGRPWWEKDIMEKLELDGKMHQPVLTKNTPSNNRMLAEVKHLVHIQPLRLPHGLPTDPSDFEHTLVTSDGRMILKRRLPEHEPEPDEVDEREKWRMQPETVKARLDRMRVTHMIHTEYHPTVYEYKKNQDGKEYRYNFNKPKNK